MLHQSKLLPKFRSTHSSKCPVETLVDLITNVDYMIARNLKVTASGRIISEIRTVAKFSNFFRYLHVFFFLLLLGMRIDGQTVVNRALQKLTRFDYPSRVEITLFDIPGNFHEL